jgi:hypothetical protein
LPFGDEAPSDAELRFAQAQIVGWREGPFVGIQVALLARQMIAQQQLQTMRRALPPGQPGQEGVPSTGPSDAERPGPTRPRIDWGSASNPGRRRPWNGLRTSTNGNLLSVLTRFSQVERGSGVETAYE